MISGSLFFFKCSLTFYQRFLKVSKKVSIIVALYISSSLETAYLVSSSGSTFYFLFTSVLIVKSLSASRFIELCTSLLDYFYASI